MSVLIKSLIRIFWTVLFLMHCGSLLPQDPAPIPPLPSQRQLDWHQLEYYAFIHFNMNTFTNMEWGLGGESPDDFNPERLDAVQWVTVAKEAGMKGIILTAKHHDGFCLWPTATTKHSVKYSKWRDGQGDVLKALSEACREQGLKFGVYLSPWDRNNAYYGQPTYVSIFHTQLRELLTNYGEIFEVWFDGANGGSGYYGGANETRKIDNKTYYQWDTVVTLVRTLQPKAVIFSDGGPDVRWVGNEQGWAHETNWSIMRRDEIYPGWPRYQELRSGHEDGTHWLPAEADVSIRPGWYYHAAEDHQVKSLPELLDIYYHSVGRNASLLLNLPVDRRGLVHENDIGQLQALREQLDRDFAKDLAKAASVVASNQRKDPAYHAEKSIDGDDNTCWATESNVTSADITFSFSKPTDINRIVLQEDIRLGQRVLDFTVEARVNGHWTPVDRQTTIGYKRILRFERVKTTDLRLRFNRAKGAILINNVEMYNAPRLVVPPSIERDSRGMVSLKVPDPHVAIFYTTDGSLPSGKSHRFLQPFAVDTPTLLRTVALNLENQTVSEVKTRRFDISKKDWKIVSVSSGHSADARKMIDDNPQTYWAGTNKDPQSAEVIIDLGRIYTLHGFTYWPVQIRYPFGIITHYGFMVSKDGHSWTTTSEGEFGNVANNRIQQQIYFKPAEARFIKLVGLQLAGTDVRATIADLGVLTIPK